MTMTHWHTCPLCEAQCGLEILTDGEQILSMRGDEQDPFSQGHICPKALGLIDLHQDPDRLRRPRKRVGNDWQDIDWDTAYAEIAAKLSAIQRHHGRNAVGLYVGNPLGHNYGGALMVPLLLQALRTRNRFSATSLDQLPLMLASLLMFGHQLLLPVPDLHRTQYLLMLGANPMVSNGSAMSVPDIRRHLKSLQAKGGKLVVVDPRHTETAQVADEHHFIRPGTDALLLLAILHTVFTEKLAKPGRLRSHVRGWERMVAIAASYPPEQVAEHIGLSVTAIRRLAREFCAAPQAVCYGRIGTCVQPFGGITTWLINVLNIVTGNLDRVGGAMFATPAIDIVTFARLMGQRGQFGQWSSRVRGLPEFGQEFPAVVMAEEITTAGQDQIRALLTVAGNPVLSSPNGGQLEVALEQLELMVAIDPYCNETTSKAHYILPPVSALERDHADLFLGMTSIQHVSKYSPPVFSAPSGSKQDWEIIQELALAIFQAQGWPEWLMQQVQKHYPPPQQTLDLLLRTGPYGDHFMPWKTQGLNLKRLKENPHGLALGQLKPSLLPRLATSHRQIELVPPAFVKDLKRLQKSLTKPIAEFVLIGRRQLRGNNSWMHNSSRLVKGRPACTLLIHPEDAQRLKVKNGMDLRVSSRVGEVTVPVELSATVMPGVVCLPHGWGHGRAGVQLQVAQAHAGVSMNDITDETWLDEMSGTAGLNGLPVRLEPVATS